MLANYHLISSGLLWWATTSTLGVRLSVVPLHLSMTTSCSGTTFWSSTCSLYNCTLLILTTGYILIVTGNSSLIAFVETILFTLYRSVTNFIWTITLEILDQFQQSKLPPKALKKTFQMIPKMSQSNQYSPSYQQISWWLLSHQILNHWYLRNCLT